MNLHSTFSAILGTLITPLSLLVSSAIVSPIVKILRVISPGRMIRTLSDLPETTNVSPFGALSVALAGTLGVGNITGVTSALIAGGPGAIFWMWVGAAVVISVKYAEVYLAVLFRHKDDGGFYGGAMYYIRDGLSRTLSPKVAAVLGGAFSLLCCANSLITGNIVQSNAASSIFPAKYRLLCGCLLGVLVLTSILYGTKKIEKITTSLIPALTAVYIIISLVIILSNIPLVPKIMADIVSSAICGKAFVGAGIGFTVKEAIRFGVIRGIFSNEAGCGTSPIAHASADTKSPHHQACYGIVEVVFDTLILCSLTAFVLLIADYRFSIIPWHADTDASPVALGAFDAFGGSFMYFVLSVLVVLFAFATIIAQLYYGVVSIGYLTKRKIPQIVYSILAVACTVFGSVISAPIMWLSADIIVGTMTAVNCLVIILLRYHLKSQRQLCDLR